MTQHKNMEDTEPTFAKREGGYRKVPQKKYWYSSWILKIENELGFCFYTCLEI